MPTYVYRCTSCGFEFEKSQSIIEAALTACPQAGCSGSVVRVITGGGGWLMKGNSSHTGQHETCCSKGEPCDHPKRCCEHD